MRQDHQDGAAAAFAHRYAYVVGGICGIFSTMDEDLTAYYNALDTLNEYMVHMQISDKSAPFCALLSPP